VLQIVNAQPRGFAEADGAEVSRYLDAVLMRRIDCSLQLGAGEHVIGFERAHTLGNPVLNRAPRVVGIFERMHLACERALALQVRTGHVHFGPHQLALVNAFLQLQIEIRLQASRRANRRHARG